MGCLRVTFPMLEGHITTMCLPRHPCKNMRIFFSVLKMCMVLSDLQGMLDSINIFLDQNFTWTREMGTALV